MTKFVVNVCSPRYQRKYQQDGWLPEFYVRYYYYYLLLLMFSIWCPCVRRECVLWGCIRLVDDGCYGHLDQRTWRIARAFGSVRVFFMLTPVVRQHHSSIKFWQGERFDCRNASYLFTGVGHFPREAMLHWAAGAGGNGVMCSADMAIANLAASPSRSCAAFQFYLRSLKRASVPSLMCRCPSRSIGCTATTGSGDPIRAQNRFCRIL